jgi:hypothetical protein
MSLFTETHLPKNEEDIALWLKESEQYAKDKHVELENKRIQKQLENQNENSSNKRKSL